MTPIPALRVVLSVALVAGVAWCGWMLANRMLGNRKPVSERTPPQQQQQYGSTELDKIYGGSEVKILQFYATSAAVVAGQPATICYSVLNAKRVSIEPPVEGVSVALSRCVEATPRKETKYTLTAQGEDGRTVSASMVVKLKPAPPLSASPAPDGPRILAFQIVKSTLEQGKYVFLLHFQVQDADEVSIDPKAFPATRAASGDFYVQPEQTTVYTLSAFGKNGRSVVKKLSVEVPNR